MGWMVVESWFGAQQGQGIFFSLEHPDHLWVLSSFLFSRQQGALSLRVNQHAYEVDYSPPSNTVVKNEWICPL